MCSLLRRLAVQVPAELPHYSKGLHEKVHAQGAGTANSLNRRRWPHSSQFHLEGQDAQSPAASLGLRADYYQKGMRQLFQPKARGDFFSPLDFQTVK